MRKEIYLKKFWELYQEKLDVETSEKRYEQGRKMVMDYQRKLEKEGWTLLHIEGGCVSPDWSTIFYSFRNPYVGQLWPWMDNPGEEYQALVKRMIESGDFILVE